MSASAPSMEERKASLKGLGTSRKRVEDARFTQGSCTGILSVLSMHMLTSNRLIPRKQWRYQGCWRF